MRKRFPLMRKFFLMLGDIVLLLLSVVVVIYAMHFFGGYEEIPVMTYVNMAPVIVVSALIIFNINGLFSLARKLFSEVFMNLVVAQFQLTVVIMAASFFFREFSYSRSVLFFSAIVQFVLLYFWKYGFWRAERTLVQPKEVLLVGSEDSCKRVLLSLKVHSHLRYKVKYISTKIAEEEWKAVSDSVDLLIICDGVELKAKADIVHFGHTTGKQVFILPAAYDLFCNGAVLDKIDDIPVFRPRYLKPTLEQRILKRALDLSVSISSLIILSPVFLVTALLVKLDSPGPIFYRQTRLGRDEKEFCIFKFRTMQENAEGSTGPVMASKNDPRVTKLGSFLRSTRIDELPQLFNVFFGEMSIVGPRPERPFFVEKFKKKLPEYIYRHNVKPGITGVAQVYGKYNTPSYDKLVYDLIYIQKSSIAEDLRLMLKTVNVLIDRQSTKGVKRELSAVSFAKYQPKAKVKTQ